MNSSRTHFAERRRRARNAAPAARAGGDELLRPRLWDLRPLLLRAAAAGPRRCARHAPGDVETVLEVDVSPGGPRGPSTSWPLQTRRSSSGSGSRRRRATTRGGPTRCRWTSTTRRCRRRLHRFGRRRPARSPEPPRARAGLRPRRAADKNPPASNNAKLTNHKVPPVAARARAKGYRGSVPAARRGASGGSGARC